MKLNEDLIKKLSKQYAPSTMLDMEFRGNDLSFKTDEEGKPILLFIGTRTADGNVWGERYARTLKYDREGNRIKDHCELTGQAT